MAAPCLSSGVYPGSESAADNPLLQPEFAMYAESDTTFYLKVVEAEITFAVGADGEVTGLTLYQNGQAIPGKKIE